MNTPVKFPIAKLLKEKGFEQRTRSYNKDGKLVTVSLTIRKFNPEKVYYPAPTIAEVCMWLYEKHGIWIYPILFTDIKKFVVNIDRIEPIFKWQLELYDSPTEAYEAAIQHTLNNLI